MKYVRIKLTRKQLKQLEPVTSAIDKYMNIPFEDRPYCSGGVSFTDLGRGYVYVSLIPNSTGRILAKIITGDDLIEL